MHQTKSVYNTGANDGLLMGIVMSATFLLMSVGVNVLVPLAYVFMIVVPVMAYFLLKKGYKESDYIWTFSGVWLHGIVMFLCGGLIMAIVAYVYMRLIQPTFIYDQFMAAIDVYNSVGTEETKNMAQTLQQVIDRHLLPSPIYVTFLLLWLVSFSGAMLSMVLAFIIRNSKLKIKNSK